MGIAWILSVKLAGAAAGAAAGWGLGRLGAGRSTAGVAASFLAALGIGAGWLMGGLDLLAGAVAHGAAFALLALLDARRAVRRERWLFLLLCGVVGLYVLWEGIGAAAAARLLKEGPDEVAPSGVVLQRTGFTCLPASAATCLRKIGQPGGEAELAAEAQTTVGGTWMRAMRRVLARRLDGTGWTVEHGERSWETLPRDGSPAIIDIELGPLLGHAVAFLGFEGDVALIGDPLGGLRQVSREALERQWSGDAIVFAKEEIR